MKKHLISAAALMLLLSLTTTANAQSQKGNIAVGLGFGYGFDLEEPAIGFGGVYTINDKFRASADLYYYMISSEEEAGITVDFTAYELNFNAHYMFVNDEKKTLYALAGVNYFNVEASISMGAISISSSDGNYGFNVGGGAEYNLGMVKLFGELKYALGDASQMFIGVGARYTIK